MSEIESKVNAIIVDKLGVEASEVKPEASFTNDLGADSLDTVELIMDCLLYTSCVSMHLGTDV